MKQAKPVLTIKTECKECQEEDGSPHIHTSACQGMYEGCQECCKGTGQQETEIYDLRDFEKCDRLIHVVGYKEKQIPIFEKVYDKNCLKCSGTGYIIPKEYEPYEIKKVSEITKERYILYNNNKIDGIQFDRYCRVLEKHNLKEDDKIVIVKK